MTTSNKKLVKEKVQDLIMHNAMNAIRILDEDAKIHNTNYDELKVIMRKELARIEKLFGIDPYSSK